MGNGRNLLLRTRALKLQVSYQNSFLLVTVMNEVVQDAHGK